MLKPTFARIWTLACLLVAAVCHAQMGTEVVADDATLSAAQQAKIVLGKLGKTLEPAKIRFGKTSKSSVAYRAKKDEYLVVQSQPVGQYYQVLLSNGQWGYIPTKSLEIQPYTVRSAAKIKAASHTQQIPLSSRSRSDITRYAENFTGTPYVWGGNSLTGGVDCSGFVKGLYGQIGLKLPRTAAEQMNVGTPIRRYEDLRAGDRLYFWDSKRGKIGHTGLYKGGGYFIHSSRGTHGVGTSYLSAKWRKILIAARR